MTELTCRRCRRPFEPRDIHPDYGIATCTRCNTVLDLRAKHPEPAKRTERAPAPMPDSVELDGAMGRFNASWSWFSAKTLFFTLFSIVWFGFLVGWYRQTGADAPLLTKLFPIGHVAAGIFIAYMSLTQWVNRTHVKVESRTLHIQHGPLPWPGGGEWSVSQFEQLYCRHRTVHSRNGSSDEYDLMGLRKDGRSVELLKGLDRADKVLWLEQELEKVLDLRDAPVKGELGRQSA